MSHITQVSLEKLVGIASSISSLSYRIILLHQETQVLKLRISARE